MVRAVVTNNFVRGGVSGLGVVNLVVGFADLTLVFGARDRSSVPLSDGTGGSL